MTQIVYTATVVTIASDEEFVGDTLEERANDGATLLQRTIEFGLFGNDKRDGESVTVNTEYTPEA